ncbi:uncharacterized protein LOC133189923 [Saccostrea echinata]|uniref:uncharacterized protein LOC133189923 n=1 Tax=Saccostrea echinata TaxID=191078 RepID=UPI002A832478|nr:uncharacterized protein LOC133189923 [Saccostrea echinata]
MPRRRKKSSHLKAPLVFTESPVNKQRNLPTPVYCAQHPVTVAQHSTSNVSWVSPQFNGVPGTVRGQRRARRRRISPPSLLDNKAPCTCQGRSNSKSPRFTRLKKKTKFASLQFVGEKTPPVTVIEDVNFTDCEDESVAFKENSPENGHRKEISLSHRDSKKKKENMDPHLGRCGVCEFMANPGVIKTPELGEVHSVTPELHSPTVPVKRLFTGLSPANLSNSHNQKLRKKGGRLKEQLKQNLAEMSSISTPNRGAPPEVLVADTPEAEYGLNTRVRRLRRRNIHDI